MKKSILLLSLLSAFQTFAFCGFYVAKADAKLFNKASKVVLVRDENKTVLTMVSDYQGDVKDFAMVVPVPQILQKGQINVADNALVDHVDAYSAPRLVEYFDPNPCDRMMYADMAMKTMAAAPAALGMNASAKKLGVKIEVQYAIGEYDILILSANDSGGLTQWLTSNGYKIPEGASDVLGSYIKQNMKFFVAKINLEKFSKEGYTFIRPIQMAFESPKFMLPIRLGTVNAVEDQDLLIYALTKSGRVETTNYRTVKIPSDKEVPGYLKNSEEFKDFYKKMFSSLVEKEGKSSVFLEYAWDMNWCDPCAADPLSQEELKKLGVFWGHSNEVNSKARMIMPPMPANPEVFITRLHVRYNKISHPEDLVFQITPDRENYQGRFIINNPWQGKPSECKEAKAYFEELKKRKENWAQNVANLTKVDVNEVRKKMGEEVKKIEAEIEKKKKNENGPWWSKLWN